MAIAAAVILVAFTVWALLRGNRRRTPEEEAERLAASVVAVMVEADLVIASVRDRLERDQRRDEPDPRKGPAPA